MPSSGNPAWNTGDVITAEKLNNIETALTNSADVAEFDETTGHRHTGAAGDAPKIDPTTGLTYVPVNKAGDTMTGPFAYRERIIASDPSGFVVRKTRHFFIEQDSTYDRDIVLFEMSRDSANWSTCSGYLVRIWNRYHSGGAYSETFIPYGYGTDGSSMKRLVMTGEGPIIPVLDSETVVSGTIVKRAVRLQIPVHWSFAVEVDYTTVEVSAISGADQVAFLMTTTTHPSGTFTFPAKRVEFDGLVLMLGRQAILKDSGGTNPYFDFHDSVGNVIGRFDAVGAANEFRLEGGINRALVLRANGYEGLRVNTSGQVFINGQTAWHAGNLGRGRVIPFLAREGPGAAISATGSSPQNLGTYVLVSSGMLLGGNVYFEAVMASNFSTQSVYCVLRNQTDAVDVVTLSTSNTGLTRVRSGALSLTPGKEYTVHAYGSSTSTKYVAQARLVIE